MYVCVYVCVLSVCARAWSALVLITSDHTLSGYGKRNHAFGNNSSMSA